MVISAIPVMVEACSGGLITFYTDGMQNCQIIEMKTPDRKVRRLTGKGPAIGNSECIIYSTTPG